MRSGPEGQNTTFHKTQEFTKEKTTALRQKNPTTFQ